MANRQQAEAAWKAACAHRDAVAERNSNMGVQNHASAADVEAKNRRQREWEAAAQAADEAMSKVWEA